MGTRAKAPAYQWYPKDFEADEAVKLMTYEEEGVYRRLLDHQWIHGSIPTDPAAVAALLPKLTPARFAELWPHIQAKFRRFGPARRALNSRLEHERKNLAKYHQGKEFAGRVGAMTRWHGVARRGSSTSSSSSTAVRTRCRHSPACTSTWLCGRLRDVAAAVEEGRLLPAEAVRLESLFRAGMNAAPLPTRKRG